MNCTMTTVMLSVLPNDNASTHKFSATTEREHDDEDDIDDVDVNEGAEVDVSPIANQPLTK